MPHDTFKTTLKSSWISLHLVLVLQSRRPVHIIKYEISGRIAYAEYL